MGEGSDDSVSDMGEKRDDDNDENDEDIDGT